MYLIEQSVFTCDTSATYMSWKKKCSRKFCTKYPMSALPRKRTLCTIQSTSVTTDRQGLPTKVAITKVCYIQGPVKLHFKITLKLIPFNLCLFLVLLHMAMNRYILHIQKHTFHIVLFWFKKSVMFVCFMDLDKHL
jgi:hypothetical protein